MTFAFVILRRITIFLFAILLICLWGEGVFSKSSLKKAQVNEITIDERTKKETLPAWLAYAGTRAEWIKTKFYQKHPKATRYSYTFAEELEAFQNMVTVWREIKNGKKDSYLDLLERVDQAGYLPQYVWTYFSDKEWDSALMPKEMDAFRLWQRQKLPHHVPEHRVTLNVDR